MRKLLLVGLLFSAFALIAACGGDDEDGGDEATSTPAATSPASTTTPSATTAATQTQTQAAGGGEATTVQTTLTEFKVELDPTSAEAGEITFETENAGAIPHQLTVIKTDLEPDALPVKDNGTVDLDQVEAVGEIDEFPAGETESGTFTLEAGKYVVICDVPGHYQGGMHAPFTVE